ncbi:hypothetical protein ACDF64_10830 [Agromyces sp. MMS24-JH15]|uniref:hypothetical protein n=1 Tax=Agromyces sp. MMS24-JH15 TaxID=3243765 RepID=UPI00374852A8
MPATPTPTWPDETPEARPTREQELAAERLAFTDRITGLEQQVKELRATSLLGPSELVAAEANLAQIQGSRTWRVGRLVMLPVRVLRAAKRRVLG